MDTNHEAPKQTIRRSRRPAVVEPVVEPVVEATVEPVEAVAEATVEPVAEVEPVGDAVVEPVAVEGEPAAVEVLPPGQRVKLNLRRMTKDAGVVSGGGFFYASQLKPGDNFRDWHDPDNIAQIKLIAETIINGMNSGTGGIRKPIEYIPGDYYEGDRIPIDDGETRYRAVLYLEGLEYAPGLPPVERRVPPDTIRIPAVAASSNRNEETRLAEQIVKNMARPPKELELARRLAYLQSMYHWTEERLAEAIGKPGQQSLVSQILALNKASSKVQAFIGQKLISATTVVGVMRDYGDRAESLLVTAVEEKLRRKNASPYEDEVLDLEAPPAPPSQARRSGGSSSARRSSGSGRSGSSGGRGGGRQSQSRSTRVTRREIDEKAGNIEAAAYNRTNFNALLQAVKHAAQYSTSEQTRDEMNETLKLIGLNPLPSLVGVDASTDTVVTNTEGEGTSAPEAAHEHVVGVEEPPFDGTEGEGTTANTEGEDTGGTSDDGDINHEDAVKAA